MRIVRETKDKMADLEVTHDELRTTNSIPFTTAFGFRPATFATLPGQLFYSTQIPVCLWFLAKNKNTVAKCGFRDHRHIIAASHITS